MKLEIAIVNAPALPVFKPELNAAAIEEKEHALSIAALIGKVTNKAQNDAAVDAMRRLKNLSNAIERQRKEVTEPFIEAQRALKRMVDAHREELDRENGRLECLVKDFTIAEQRRIREEQEAQERELRRIEAEKQAELKRIADEQARLAREAQAATDAAAKQAAEAEQARLAAEAARVTELADHRAALESRPVEITKASGQVIRKQWVIQQINDLQLMRARPDLIRKVEWDMVAIKEILNSGQKLPGVCAVEDLRIGTRGGSMKAIDV